MLNAHSAFSGVSVNDSAKAKEFYMKILGLELESEEMGLLFKLPNNSGKIFIYDKQDHQPATYTVLNFVVDDIDKAVSELAAVGVQFERYDSLPAPQDEKGVLRGLVAEMGPDIAWFKDPAGNILSILQNK
jgi:predicted enzyme related to lactoylglutathione lyase